MREIIFLRVSRHKVEAMTKNMPALNRGEIPVKLTITVEDGAFREPVISKEVIIDDWREGIDIADVEFKQNIITPEEAEMVKQARLDKMQKILITNGYTVTKEETADDTRN